MDLAGHIKMLLPCFGSRYQVIFMSTIDDSVPICLHLKWDYLSMLPVQLRCFKPCSPQSRSYYFALGGPGRTW